MDSTTLGVVISFCTIDKEYLKEQLKQCSTFADKIVVVYSNHLYDGTPEDIDWIRLNVPAWVELIQCSWSSDKPARYWHNHVRMLGHKYLAYTSEVDYILYLDADEVPVGDEFKQWLESTELKGDYKMANYVYWKSNTNRATTHQDSILLNRANIDQNFYNEMERGGMGHKPKRMTMGSHEQPMFHHFSWSKRDLQKKVDTWAHKTDRDWQSVIDHETDPWGYTYETVKLPFDEIR